MRKLGIPEEIISQFDCSGNKKGNPPEPTIEFIDLMDKLLTKEQCLAVMEEQGCCKGGKRDKDCKAFGKEHAKKPLAEKLALLSGVEYMMAPRLNDDGTITIEWGGHQNGVHTGKTTCSCGAIKKLKQTIFCIAYILWMLCGTFSIPLSKRSWSKVAFKRNSFIAAEH